MFCEFVGEHTYGQNFAEKRLMAIVHEITLSNDFKKCKNGKVRCVEIVLKISSRQGAVRRVWGEERKKVRVWFIVKASYYNCYSLADLKLSWQKQKWTYSDQFWPNMWR